MDTQKEKCDFHVKELNYSITGEKQAAFLCFQLKCMAVCIKCVQNKSIFLIKLTPNIDRPREEYRNQLILCYYLL